MPDLCPRRDGAEELDAGHVRQVRVEHQAVDPAGVQRGERLCAAIHRGHPHVARVCRTDHLDNAPAARLVAHDHKQGLRLALYELCQRRAGRATGRRGDRFVGVGDGAVVEGTPSPVRLGRDDVDGDVARARVVLEMVQHPPPGGVARIQGDRVGVQPVGQGHGRLCIRGDNGLEAVLMGAGPQEACEVAVLFQDQQHPLRRPAREALLAPRVRAQGPLCGRSPRVAGGHGAGPVAVVAAVALRQRRRSGPADAGGLHHLLRALKAACRPVDEREVQGEGAALVGCALHRQLTAQQVGDFPTDR